MLVLSYSLGLVVIGGLSFVHVQSVEVPYERFVVRCWEVFELGLFVHSRISDCV